MLTCTMRRTPASRATSMSVREFWTALSNVARPRGNRIQYVLIERRRAVEARRACVPAARSRTGTTSIAPPIESRRPGWFVSVRTCHPRLSNRRVTYFPV